MLENQSNLYLPLCKIDLICLPPIALRLAFFFSGYKMREVRNWEECPEGGGGGGGLAPNTKFN